jgi:hypothetical protein
MAKVWFVTGTSSGALGMLRQESASGIGTWEAGDDVSRRAHG